MRRSFLPALAVGSTALYVLLLPVAFSRFGAGFVSVSLVPLTLIPWAFGARAGMLAAVGLALVNYLWFGVLPDAERPQAQRLVWFGLPFSFAFAVAVAYVRGMQRRLEELNAALARAALTDPLTGLPNRRALEADLARAVQEAPGGFALVLIDVDGLKAVNDSQGHARGDALLQAFSAGFGRAFAPGGRVYRLSGDEFAVLLGGAGDDADPGVVATVLAVARDVGTRFPGAGASAGVSVHRPGLSTSALLVDADHAMYAHKERTRRETGRSTPACPTAAAASLALSGRPR